MLKKANVIKRLSLSMVELSKDLKDQDAVASVMKVFAILQSISEEPEIGITALSQKVLMPKSTLFRFLQTLKMLGYVNQEEDGDKYSLTLKLFELGSKALEHIDLVKYADAKMQDLSKITKETTHLGIIDGENLVYIHKVDSQYQLRMYSRIGRHRPLYCTAIGKILLAWLQESEVQSILKQVEFIQYTKNTLPNIDQLLNELKEVRQLGYAADQEEVELGLLCLAAPIYNRFGTVIAGLSLSFPALRFDTDQKQRYIQLLHQYAAEISACMGLAVYPRFSASLK